MTSRLIIPLAKTLILRNASSPSFLSLQLRCAEFAPLAAARLVRMTHLITLLWGSNKIFLEASALRERWNELWNVNNPRSFCSVSERGLFSSRPGYLAACCWALRGSVGYFSEFQQPLIQVMSGGFPDHRPPPVSS